MTEQPKREALLPCPHDDRHVAEVLDCTDDDPSFMAGCRECGLWSENVSEEEAVAGWNVLCKDIQNLRNGSAEMATTILTQQAELERVKKANKLLDVAVKRYLPCPDHRDKVSITENGCPYCQLDRVKAELAAVRDVITQIANIAHHGGLLGVKDAAEAMIDIRRLSLPYWDRSEANNLQSLK